VSVAVREIFGRAGALPGDRTSLNARVLAREWTCRLALAQFLLFCGSLIAASTCVAGDSDKKSAKEAFSDPRVAQLALAAEKGDVEKIDALVKDGVSVNAKGHSNMTPLLFCFFAKNKKGYSALLRHKADPNVLTSEGESVIYEAASEADPFWLREALKHGGNPNLAPNGFSGSDS
jgi:ankyrin repeat protein